METKNQYFTISGIALFPKYDSESRSFRFCLCLTNKQAEKIDELCEKANADFEPINLSDVEYEDNTYKGLNVKSSFDFPVYDKDGNKLDDEPHMVYHGATVKCSLIIKEYTYKRKKGLTCYVNGVIVYNQGTPAGVTFERLMESEEIVDDLPF